MQELTQPDGNIDFKIYYLCANFILPKVLPRTLLTNVGDDEEDAGVIN